MAKQTYDCPICATPAGRAATVRGKIPPLRDYPIHHCPNCRFSFIPDYRTDFEVVYSDDYYQGAGGDPFANYLFDLQEPNRTLRRYEWRGLLKIFQTLTKASGGAGAADLRWLDYGCGFGSLVRFGREMGLEIFGYEPCGFNNSKVVETLSDAERKLLPYIVSDGPPAAGAWDYVTAIEVIEHAPDPLAFLSGIRPLLKDGGILFLTTGNALPFRGKLDQWSYSTYPDVHISFFEPQTLALALEKTGFKPVFPGYIPGCTEIITYKILKNLRFKRYRAVLDLIPWPLLARAADALLKVTALPYGVAS
jgi:SAM-dependent methyltransferase